MKTQLQTIKLSMYIIILLISSICMAQQGINYQGLARTSEGNLLANADIILDISINKTSPEGETMYSEIHELTTDSNGVFSLVISEGTPVLNEFNNVNWAEDIHYLSVKLDGEDLGSTKFEGVPYAQAIGKFQMHKNGLTTKGTGGSIFIGENAGEFDDFTDNHNIGIGANALNAATEAYNNVAIGEGALKFNRTGSFNVAIGKKALENNITGGSNIAIGLLNLNNNIEGTWNVAIGRSVLEENINGDNNIGMGFAALNKNTTGTDNLAQGYYALFNNTQGTSNIAMGSVALKTNTTGSGNFAAGNRSMWRNTTGNSNIGIGGLSLTDNTTGSNNIALGLNALGDNTTGSNNIAFGENALGESTIGLNNIALGKNSLLSIFNGSNNFAAGEDALRNASTAVYNIAVGYQSQQANVNSENNISLGRFSLKSTVASSSNIAIGYQSLENHLTGGNNIGVGRRALQNHIDGDGNVSIGSGGLLTNLTGANNTSLGINAGRSSLGSNSIFIGFEAGKNDFNGEKLYIESSDSDTPLFYGEFDDDILGFHAKVGIGTKAPVVPLHIKEGTDLNLSSNSGFFTIGNEDVSNLVMDSNEIQARNGGVVSDLYLQNEGGNVRVGGAVVHASDRRLKRDINDISYGLKDVLELRPTEYFWKGKTQDYKSLGLIAQEVKGVIKNIVTHDAEEDKFGVSYTELIPVLIKAIQEQHHIIKQQQKRNNKQSQQMAELDAKIKVIETKIAQFN